MKRRRLSALLSCCAVVLPLVAACGGGSGGPAGLKVTGGFGEQPSVVFPKGGPPKGLVTDDLVAGKGAKVGDGDLVIANYAGYTWDSAANKLIASSFVGTTAAAFPTWKLVPGLRQALVGRRTGTRLVTVVPPALAYGTAGDTSLNITAADSLVYVLDVVASFGRTATAAGTAEPLHETGLPQVGTAAAGQAPPVSIPHGTPPGRLTARTLVQGTGKAVASGQIVAVQYAGYLWRTGRSFGSSYADGHAYSAVIGAKQVVQGWDQGLVGQKVGSRVLLVVPPSAGYGTQGLKQAGIRGTDTLVYVIDILGAY